MCKQPLFFSSSQNRSNLLQLHLALACLLPACPLLLLTYTTFSGSWEGGRLPPYLVLLRRYGGSGHGQAVLENSSSSSSSAMSLFLFRDGPVKRKFKIRETLGLILVVFPKTLKVQKVHKQLILNCIWCRA